VSAATGIAGRRGPIRVPLTGAALDYALLGTVATLLSVGLIMVASASLHLSEEQLGHPFHYVLRQGLFIALGLGLGWIAWMVPLWIWQRAGRALLLVGFVLLVLVLVPGLGREVNGAARWLPLGPLNLQVSELHKLLMVIFMAGYVVRRGAEIRRSWWGLLKPMILLALTALLLLAEPDFGAAAVLAATVVGMLFIAGARMAQLAAVLGVLLVTGAALIVTAPYRLQRLLVFLDPWQDPFDRGFQLTQALIAFGRGEWWGVGLGAGVQKLFYLPEAHTDFLLAVLAEEAGLAGVVAVVFAFGFVTWRALALGARAHRVELHFAGYLASGLGIWLGLQAFVNMGVNMGLLPTKGLTLPLMSYGGSSMLISCFAIGLLLRIHREVVPREPEGALEQDRCARA
jgi:cell division protein FtsW